VKVLALRRDDTCTRCAAPLPAGTRAYWDAAARETVCAPCLEGATVPDQPAAPSIEQPADSAAGASAQREFARRSARREADVRARHPRLGGLLLALSDDPSSTRVWAQGARGERLVAEKIDELAGEHLVALHDRRIPGTKANIDHIAVTASGVWVVDAKSHKGRLEVRRSGGLFSPRVEKLVISGRDQTKLLTGLCKQVERVRMALLDVAAPLEVRGALCFVDTELPWASESIDGVPLVGRRGLAKLLKREGALTSDDREATARFLASRFPPA
jgi:hypothetical protein